MKIIRPAGIIPFVLIILGVFFAAEWLVKKTLVAAGEAAFDAKVTITDVEIDFLEQRLSIHHMTVGDKEKPMNNLFEFSSATADLDLLKAFLGSAIVDELMVSQLQTGTQRTTSALLPNRKKTKKEKQKAEDKEEISSVAKAKMGEAMPSADAILAREQLLTDKSLEQLQQTLDQSKEQWEKIEKDLPTDDVLAQYEKDIEIITKGKVKSLSDFKEKQKKLKQLKKQLKADKKALSNAKDLLKERQPLIQHELKLLKAAPEQDLANIQSKYSFDESGLLNVAGMLFGGSVKNVTGHGLYWYKKIKPLLSDASEEKDQVEKQRDYGSVVRFSDHASPDFWVKNAAISMILPAGGLDIKISDLTSQQKLTGKPVTASVDSTALKGMARLRADLMLDYRKEPSEALDLKIDQYVLKETSLSKDENFKLSLVKANADIDASIKRKEGHIANNIDIQFKGAVFAGEAKDEAAAELLEALRSIGQFYINAASSAGVDDFKVSSDLDDQLKYAVKGRLKEKQSEIEDELRLQLEEKVAGYLGEADVDFLQGEGQGLDLNSKKIDELLGQKLDDYKGQEADKAKDKLKGKLKKLF